MLMSCTVWEQSIYCKVVSQVSWFSWCVRYLFTNKWFVFRFVWIIYTIY